MPRYSLSFLVLATCIAPFHAAHACQLICVKTTATYNGNLGGQTGADAKCATEYPGFKYVRSPSLPLNSYNPYSGGGGSGVPSIQKFAGVDGLYNGYYDNSTFYTYYAWIGTAYNGGPQNCSNWTSSSVGAYGGTLYANNGIAISSLHCDVALPLICCNM